MTKLIHTPNVGRRTLLRAFATCAAPVAFGPLVYAQGSALDWPKSPIKVVVAFPAGGTTDLLARIVAQGLSTRLGQPVIVDNRPGASGAIGTQAVARSSADGYTLTMATIGTHALNPVLQKLPYDPIADFQPVTEVARTPNVLLAHPGSQFRTLADVLAAARAKPGALAFGSTSAGGSPHMSGELMKYMAKVDLLHVPYKGSAPMMTDLIGGQIPLAFDNLPTAVAHIRTGKVLALAVTSAKRSPLLPDVPTMAEAGIPGYEMDAWFALFAPARTPIEIAEKVQAGVADLMRDPTVAKQMAEQGALPMASTPQAFAARQAAELKKWAQVVAATGVKLE